MDGLGCAVAAAATTSITSCSILKNSVLFSSVSAKNSRRRSKNVSFTGKGSKFRVFAEKEEPKLDKQDLMELKFGRLIGEDPKLTLAKIMRRKVNPDMSYKEIEKEFYKNKGKMVEFEELTFDVSDIRKESSSQSSGSLDGLSLTRPVPKKGFEFKEKPQKPTQGDGKGAETAKKSMAPNVILRKPSGLLDDHIQDRPSRYEVQPNLSLNMWKEPRKEEFSDMTLIRKPEPMNPVIEDDDQWDKLFEDDNVASMTLLERPELIAVESKLGEQEATLDANIYGSQLNEEISASSTKEEISVENALQGRPKRLDRPVKKVSSFSGEETLPVSREDIENSAYISKLEVADWSRAENYLRSGVRVDVDLLSHNDRGFVASLGSLVGLFPYRNLAGRLKFKAFESWLREKGLEPAKYKQYLGVTRIYDTIDRNSSPDEKLDGEISSDMSFEDLLSIYNEEKLKFFSSFVGQRIKVNVVMADRKSRKLLFSVRPREKQELVEKKRAVMAKLRVGDIVKCSVTKITYSGIFVEVEGVPALIYQSEVSWDATLDPSSFLKVGQILDAKVYQLDVARERIFLSLKEITTESLNETLESVGLARDTLEGGLVETPTDVQWTDVESLIKELQQVEGIQSVSKGRFFLSPGLAPTFQVYMASMFENEYKLLARSENKVQEVIVKSTLSNEEMKSVILLCTNKVE